VIVTLLLFLITIQTQAAPSPCATASACRLEAQAAIDARDYERAHDLAWLAFQKGPRDDPETLQLLARAQSLSGRGDDAFVMLRRLADRGVVPRDLRESEEFRRVREHARWPELLAVIEEVEAKAAPAAVAALPAKDADDSRRPVTALPAAPSAPPAATPASEAAASPAAAPTSPNAPAMTVTEAEPTHVGDELTLPRAGGKPVAIAYDGVSARFVVGYSGSDALTVLSQTSTNAAAFTTPGWSGGLETLAAAIDRQSGDLWIAVRTEGGSALHRLQLISGRRLEVVEVPDDPAAELTALTITADGVLALDRTGHRIFKRARRSTALEVVATLPAEISATSVASTRSAIYVAHADGIRRIDPTTRRQQNLTAADASVLAGWHSIAAHDRVLLGIQQHGDDLRVLRARLNAAGSRIIRVETLGSAAFTSATLANGVFYFFSSESPTGVQLRGITAK
jgi:hypothetical protein